MLLSKIALSVLFTAAITGTAFAGILSTPIGSPSIERSDSHLPLLNVNGFHNVTEVFHSNGRFIRNGNRWTEFGNNGAQFNFTEVGTDNTSIYLRDNSRGVNLRLDLTAYQIFYSDDSGKNFPLYIITSFSNPGSGSGQIGSAVWSEEFTCNEGIPLVLEFEDKNGDLTVAWTHDGFRGPNKLPQVVSGSGNRFSDGRNEIQTKGTTAVVNLDGIRDVCTQLQ